MGAPTPPSAAHNPRVQENTAVAASDTVRMKIGGPLMTVLSVDEEHCCCMWFADDGKFQHGRFELDVVELVEHGVRLIDPRQPASALEDRSRRHGRVA